MTSKMRTGILACITMAVLALSASGASGASAAARSPHQLTTGQLKARLLSLGNLPSGYVTYPHQTDYPVYSNHPACMNTLDGLDSPAAPRGVTEASASYALSTAGPWIFETLRSYPGQGAAQAFNSATATLGGCRSFSLSWNNPPEAATETVQPRGSVRLGNQSWSAAIGVITSIPVTGTMILVRTGSSTMLLEVYSSVTLPTPAQIVAMAARATSKLAG
jgi:hypothetical protein